nr:MAG TPA: hypothetical protein [Caudoviricetes sp.]
MTLTELNKLLAGREDEPLFMSLSPSGSNHARSERKLGEVVIQRYMKDDKSVVVLVPEPIGGAKRYGK